MVTKRNSAVAKRDEEAATAAATTDTVPEGASILMMIERAARDPSVDIDKMERLFAMHEASVAREAKRLFVVALAAAKAEIKPIARKHVNETTRSRFADIAALAEAIDPILTKYGFVLTFDTYPSEFPGHYGVAGVLMHTGGHEQRYRLDVPSDAVGMKGTPNKTPTHAFGSSMTYGRRYLKLLITDASLVDDDGNAASDMEPITDDQLAKLRKKIEEAGADVERLCERYQIAALPDLPQPKYELVMAMLEIKRLREGESENGEKGGGS